MWRPRYAPPYDPNDDPWQHGIFGEQDPASERPSSSQQPLQQGTGPLASTGGPGEAPRRFGRGRAARSARARPPRRTSSSRAIGVPAAPDEPKQQQQRPHTGARHHHERRHPPQQDRGNLLTKPTQPQQTAPPGGPPNGSAPQWHQSPSASTRTPVASKIQGTTHSSPSRDQDRRPTSEATACQARPAGGSTQAAGSWEPPTGQNTSAQAAASTAQTRCGPTAGATSSRSGDSTPGPAAPRNAQAATRTPQTSDQPTARGTSSSSSGDAAPEPAKGGSAQAPTAATIGLSPLTTHSSIYRQVFGYDRDPPLQQETHTATAETPGQETSTEPEDTMAAAATEGPQQSTEDAWERLRASLQHLDTDPIVGIRREPGPKPATQTPRNDEQPPQQQPTGEPPYPQQRPAPPADEQATAAATSTRARSASQQRQGAQAAQQPPGHLPPLDPWSRKRRPWQPQPPPRHIPMDQHDFHDQPQRQAAAWPAQEVEQTTEPGPSQQTTTAQRDEEAGASSPQQQGSSHHAASGDVPQDHSQPPAQGDTTTAEQRVPQDEPAAPQHNHEQAYTPEGIRSLSGPQQHQGWQHPPHQAAASSSSETGTPSSAAQQWGRYTPGSGDQRTRNKADKTWIHAEFSKRGWRKPPHLTWRQVEHWLYSKEQREQGERERPQQGTTRTHQPGLFTQLLNLHLQPRAPSQGTPPQTGPSSTAASSSQAPPQQPQQEAQEQTVSPRGEDHTTKQATQAQQEAEERMDATQPHVTASGTAPQPSHTTSIEDAPIRAKAPPNEDPTSKEGTRAKERAQQRHQPAEAANRTHQGDERARPRQGTRPRGPGSVLPHQHPTGSTRVAATPTARAHRRNSEAVHVPPNFAQVTWLDSGVPPTFPPSLPLQAYSQMLCLYRGSGRWDLRILSTSPDAEPFLAQGIYPQVLYAPGPTRHEQWFPVGAGLVATPLGDVALASRQRWGLTSSLMPAAWLIQVDQTRRRAHGEPEIPGEVELRRGESFLIIWEEDGWTLFERYPGDVAAWTTTVMPAGTEVSHHNHILLPEQRVHDGDVPPAQDPNASSSQARGQRSGESPTRQHRHSPQAAAPARATEAKEHGRAMMEGDSSTGTTTVPSSCSAPPHSHEGEHPPTSRRPTFQQPQQHLEERYMTGASHQQPLPTRSSGHQARRPKRKCWQWQCWSRPGKQTEYHGRAAATRAPARPKPQCLKRRFPPSSNLKSRGQARRASTAVQANHSSGLTRSRGQ